MKQIIAIVFFCCVALLAFGQDREVPGPQGYINDFDSIFTSLQIKSLDSMVREFEKETTVEIALLTIDGSYTTAGRFDSLVIATHNAWGVGKKGKNNGILIVICLDFRKIRINTGSGVEKKLTNEEAMWIIDKTILPAFRVRKYYEGASKGIVAIMQQVR